MLREWSGLWEAMDKDSATWFETTPKMYSGLLGVAPPRAIAGSAFLVGEISHNDAEGRQVYACFNEVGGKFFARYMTVRQFKEGV